MTTLVSLEHVRAIVDRNWMEGATSNRDWVERPALNHTWKDQTDCYQKDGQKRTMSVAALDLEELEPRLKLQKIAILGTRVRTDSKTCPRTSECDHNMGKNLQLDSLIRVAIAHQEAGIQNISYLDYNFFDLETSTNTVYNQVLGQLPFENAQRKTHHKRHVHFAC